MLNCFRWLEYLWSETKKRATLCHLLRKYAPLHIFRIKKKKKPWSNSPVIIYDQNQNYKMYQPTNIAKTHQNPNKNSKNQIPTIQQP